MYDNVFRTRAYNLKTRAWFEQTINGNAMNRAPQQITASRGNPSYNSHDGLDHGGPFWTHRWYWTTRKGGPPVPLSHWPRTDYYYNRGVSEEVYASLPLFPVPLALNAVVPLFQGYSHFEGNQPSSLSVLQAWGAKAVEACKPTRTANSLYVSLKELKQDGLPKLIGAALWQEKTRALKKVGGEYLNYQFGWVPLVNDIQKFFNTASQFERIWSQYERDAGKPVHRRFRPDPVETVSVTNPSYAYFGGINPEYGTDTTGRTITRRVITEQRNWFSGSFMYYLPSRGDLTWLSKFRRELSRLNKLLGIVPTPDMIWSATPWTWALDWFSNAGSVISNLSDVMANGLVMNYGYAMQHTKTTYEIISVGGRRRTGPLDWAPMPAIPLVIVEETKQRIQASPYGFGLTWSGFSPQQLAILASLGMTRGR